MVALWEVVKLPAFALNTAEMTPPSTLTEAGTASIPLPLESETVRPRKGASAFSVTVQTDAPPGASVVGMHTTPDTSAGTLMLIVPPLPGV